MSEQPARLNFPTASLTENNHELLAKLRKDPRIKTGLFLALPTKLINAIERNLGDKLPAEDLQFEQKASSVLIGQQIGWWRGNFITSAYFGEPPSNVLPLDTWRRPGVPEQDIELARIALESSQADRDRIRTALVAYVGWLTTNPDFISEHDALVKKHQARISADGFPLLGNFNVAAVAGQPPAKKGPKIGRVIGNKVLTYLSDFEAFLVRWRLQGLNAPYTPEPLGPQFPVLDPQRMSNHMAAGGRTLYFPDTLPTPGRDDLRDLVEQSLGRHSANPPEHLQGWTKIIAGDTMSKNQLPRYARIARLQLYWTALHFRYKKQLQRSKGKLIVAFAEYYHLSDDAIKNDLTLIDERMNGNWPRPYAIGS